MAAVHALKALKLPTPARDEQRGNGRGGNGRRDDRAGGERRFQRPAGPRATIQPTGGAHAGERRDGAARADGQRHPQRTGAHPAHRPDGGGPKRPFNRGRSGRPARAQG